MSIKFTKGPVRHNGDGFILVGWFWFRNGSWASTYGDGRRLFYVYWSPVLFNVELFELLVTL